MGINRFKERFQRLKHVRDNCRHLFILTDRIPGASRSSPCWWWERRTLHPGRRTCDGLRPRRAARPWSTSCWASGTPSSWTRAWPNRRQRCRCHPRSSRSWAAPAPEISHILVSALNFRKRCKMFHCKNFLGHLSNKLPNHCLTLLKFPAFNQAPNFI